MDEIVTMHRNTGSQEQPVWEKWYPLTKDDAVVMTDESTEDTQQQTVTLKQKIAELKQELATIESQVAELNGDVTQLNSDCYKLSGGIEIPENSDMKSSQYLNPGNYYCPTNVTAATLSNCPFTAAFVLKVERSAGVGTLYIRQTFKKHDSGDVVTRVYVNDTWREDIQYVTSASQSLNIIQRLGLTTRDGITDVLDINNEPGIYNVDLTKLNLPVSTYGIVAIVKNASGNWIYAIFIPTDMTAMYFAFYNGYSTPAGWTAWKRVSFSAIT